LAAINGDYEEVDLRGGIRIGNAPSWYHELARHLETSSVQERGDDQRQASAG
jgi:hypothetical protein